jgi:hypothetical protein
MQREYIIGRTGAVGKFCGAVSEQRQLTPGKWEAMKMNPIAVLLAVFGVCGAGADGQVKQPAPDQPWNRTSGCAGSFQSGTMRCAVVLQHGLNAKKSKAGDQIRIRTEAVIDTGEGSIATLDATIVEVQTGAKGGSVLRIRIAKGRRVNGQEVPLEARIVALVAPRNIAEAWQFPTIIVDRFPRIPQDDERLPGERKRSEDLPQTSPLDSWPETPVRYKTACSKPQETGLASGCTSLLEAKGVYGYKATTIEPSDPVTPADSVFASKKDMRFSAGTILVLEMANTHALVSAGGNQEPE